MFVACNASCVDYADYMFSIFKITLYWIAALNYCLMIIKMFP